MGRIANPSATVMIPAEKPDISLGRAQDGAQDSGEIDPPPAAADPDLEAVVRAWPDLPRALRSGILAMVRAAAPGGAGAENQG